MQSVCSEQKLNALAAHFIYAPVGENVDWKLAATISPCHVTVIPWFALHFLVIFRSATLIISAAHLHIVQAHEFRGTIRI